MPESSLPNDHRARIAALNEHVEAMARLLGGESLDRHALADALGTIRADLDELAAGLTRLESHERDIEELEQRVASLTASRDAVAANLGRLQQRRAVRAALGAVDAVSGLRTRIPTREDLARRARESARTQLLIERRMRALRPDPGPQTGPVVSIIVPTRDGAHHLRRLFSGLRERTVYRPFEVIVVDNASSDDTPAVLAEFNDLDIRHLRNDQNRSFSEACNQGAAEALGELLLFLNNDTSPINDGWLGAMVMALQSNREATAAGALLVYPAHRSNKGAAHTPLTVQHRGIGFIWKNGGPRPINLGTGERPERRELTDTTSVAAATAACLLVERGAFEAVGGFDDRYVYGWEDVDLCMKLRRHGGDILMCGGAALFHHEFGTQDLLGSETRRMNYLNNSRVFTEQWAPQLRRLYLRDRIRGDRFWSCEGSASVAITVTDLDQDAGYGDWYTAHELGDALTKLGWTVTYIQRKNDDWYDTGGADVVIMLLPHLDVAQLPEGTFTVAWVRNWVERWLDNPSFGDVDLVVASASAFAEQIETATAHSVEIIPLATNPERFHPVEPDLALECDYTFTGSFWGGTGRTVERYFDVRPGETFTIYGKGWDTRPRAQRYWRGHLDYNRLPVLYSSAKVAIDDTVEPNVPAVNSRVFDALAAGCLIITDNAAGSAEWFDDLLPTYTNREELRAQLDHYLADDEARAALIDKTRSLLLERHTYSRRAQQFTDAILQAVDRPEIGFRIGPVTWEYAEQWGDTHFARDMARAMRRRGWRTRIAVVSDWDDPREQASDVVVHLRGRTPYATKPGSVNAMWMISHPEDTGDAELEKYDLVAVASTHHATELASRLAVPVVPLLQATSERYLGAERDDALAVEVLFVGNSRGERRPIVDWAIEAGLAVTVFGSGWEDLIPPKYVGGEYFPNDRLPDLYRSAGVVLNDHWPDMAAHGFISNRIFDALGAGAPVISDEVPGLAELAGGSVMTVAGASELADAVRSAARLDVRTGVEHVKAQHTFDTRAETLESVLLPHLEQRATIAGGGPGLAFVGNGT